MSVPSVPPVLRPKNEKSVIANRETLPPLMALQSRWPGLMLWGTAVLALLMSVWMRAAFIIYALFFGIKAFPGFDHIASMLFTTFFGWAMLKFPARLRHFSCRSVTQSERMLFGLGCHCGGNGAKFLENRIEGCLPSSQNRNALYRSRNHIQLGNAGLNRIGYQRIDEALVSVIRGSLGRAIERLYDLAKAGIAVD